MLASTLQRCDLAAPRSLDRRGRVPVCEILRTTGRVRDRILKPGRRRSTSHNIIFDGGYDGMQTFDQALYGHVAAGRVTRRGRDGCATSPHDFKLLLEAEGRRGTTMADVPAALRAVG